MMECMRLIIGEVGTREREGGGLKVGRSERSRTTWTAVKGPQYWGRKWRLQSFAADPPRTRGKRPAVTQTETQPKKLRVFEAVQVQTAAAREQKCMACSHAVLMNLDLFIPLPLI